MAFQFQSRSCRIFSIASYVLCVWSLLDRCYENKFRNPKGEDLITQFPVFHIRVKNQSEPKKRKVTVNEGILGLKSWCCHVTNLRSAQVTSQTLIYDPPPDPR